MKLFVHSVELRIQYSVENGILVAVLTRPPEFDIEGGYVLASTSIELIQEAPALMLAFQEFAMCAAQAAAHSIAQLEIAGFWGDQA